MQFAIGILYCCTEISVDNLSKPSTVMWSWILDPRVHGPAILSYHLIMPGTGSVFHLNYTFFLIFKILLLFQLCEIYARLPFKTVFYAKFLD